MNDSKPKPNIIGLPVEATVHPRPDVAGIPEDPRGLRVRSSDYGTGTVVADIGIGIQIWWDKALAGTADQHMLTHDKSYVAGLERL